MKIFQQFHHLSYSHQLIVLLVILERLMYPRHSRPCSVCVLIKQIFEYLEMLFDKEPHSVLVLLFLEAQVKQLELF